MYVDYSGWTQKDGPFQLKVFVDETKTDHAIHYANDTVARQSSGFGEHTTDWNNDGDVYPKFGAWFEYLDEKGSFAGGEFFTPVDLVRFAADALDPECSSMGPRVTKVDGVTIPEKNRHISLDERVRQTEARAMHQDAERNRKMASLGIRPPNEPWAR